MLFSDIVGPGFQYLCQWLQKKAGFYDLMDMRIIIPPVHHENPSPTFHLPHQEQLCPGQTDQDDYAVRDHKVVRVFPQRYDSLFPVHKLLYEHSFRQYRLQSWPWYLYIAKIILGELVTLIREWER